MDQMYRDINRVLHQSFWVSGLGLAASAVFIWLLSTGLMKRLTLLSRNIALVNEQRFDRIVDISGGDEIGVLAGDFNHMAARIDALINEVYEGRLAQMDLLVKQRDAELDALQSRINPHFIFNTLDSIRMHTILDEKDKAAQMIAALSELFRYGAGKGEDVVTLAAELKNVRDFVGIFMLRYGERVSAEIDVPNALLGRPVPRLILQPVVENAFIHGLKNPRGILHLRVYAQTGGDGVDAVVVEDDGSGIDPERLEWLNAGFSAPIRAESERIGLKNVSDRLRLFYGDRYRLHIESQPGAYTRVTVPVPERARGRGPS